MQYPTYLTSLTNLANTAIPPPTGFNGESTTAGGAGRMRKSPQTVVVTRLGFICTNRILGLARLSFDPGSTP